MAEKHPTIDAYIAAQPAAVQAVLTELRNRIHQAVPDAEESMSYDIPTFKRNGKYFVYMAAWQKHISMYPIPSGDAALEQEMAPYRAGKGTLQFPLEDPLPYELIDRVVHMLVAQRM
jgi:uncharacterized protein YdhG (YjbR/CyaY superfamily)